MELGVRAGPVSAYPQANQPYFTRIGRGMALQVSGGASIGGYDGENYRMYIIADKAARHSRNSGTPTLTAATGISSLCKYLRTQH